MKIPKAFQPEKTKELTKEDFDRMANETLVKEVVIEEVAKKLENYFESIELAKSIQLNFRRDIDLQKEVWPKKEEYLGFFKKKKNVKLKQIYEYQQKEIKAILKELLTYKKNIKEEEINIETDSLNIISNDAIYSLEMRMSTPWHLQYNQEIKIVNEFDEELKKEITVRYFNPTIIGKVKYVKFNRDHNEKLMKAIKNNGYSINIQHP
ncbi:MAG: hypothetical protein KKA79_05580 [Nanoarchaeota archaeon]|nr:hypothetical protein [Nanoarchaeota archaeon]MCG2718389.1 hypothetical protein [Nanoarchaeota archaeon]